MSVVYVEWYGKVLEGELLEDEEMGMKQVRIPLDGHHPVALFTPGHVYESVEQMQQVTKEYHSYPKELIKSSDIVGKASSTRISDVVQADDREQIEAFKRKYWDMDRNHLCTDKLEEFYQLWRMLIVVPPKPPVRIVSDEKMKDIKEELKKKFAEQQTDKKRKKKQSNVIELSLF